MTLDELLKMTANFGAASKAARESAAAQKVAAAEAQKNARAQAEAAKEAMRLARAHEAQARLVEKEAQKGRQQLGRMAGTAFGAASATIGGMTRSGFSNTVEGYRLNYAFQRVSYQLAAIFSPAVEKAANVTERVAGWFERLTGKQQDALQTVGLLTVGLVAVGGAVRVFTTSLAAAALGAKVFGATAAVSGAAGAAGAAAGGAAAGGLGAGAAAAGGAVAGGFMARAGRFVRGAGRFALRAAVPLAAAAAVFEGVTGGYDEMLRKRGENKLVSTLGALGGGALNILTFGAFKNRLRERGEIPTEAEAAAAAAAADPGRHRNVTPMPSGFGDVGSNYFRIAEEVLKVGAAQNREQEDEQKKQTTILEDIADQLKALRQLLGI